MPHIQMSWPIATGVSEPLPVRITNVSVDALQGILVVYVAPLDGTGQPIPGQQVGLQMSQSVYDQFAASETVPMLQAILGMGSAAATTISCWFQGI